LPLEPRKPSLAALDDRQGVALKPTIPAHLRRDAQSIRAGDNGLQLRGLGFGDLGIGDNEHGFATLAPRKIRARSARLFPVDYAAVYCGH
jgi:hypothetical protein